MNKFFIVIAILFSLTACETRTTYEEKKVPVYRVPEPPIIERPELPIHDLEISVASLATDDKAIEKIGEISQAYVVSVRLLMNWGLANERIVETYRRMSEEDFSVDPVSFAAASARRLANESEEAGTPPGLFGTGEESSEIESTELEASRSDYATLETFANQEFNKIINKYNEDKEKILREANETEADQKDQ